MATQYTVVPLLFLYCTIWSHKISTNAYKCKRQTTINYIRKPFSLLWQEWIYWDIHQRRMDWVFVVSRCQLLHIERMDNKFLLCSTGNYIQCPGINDNGKEFFKKNTYVSYFLSVLRQNHFWIGITDWAVDDMHYTLSWRKEPITVAWSKQYLSHWGSSPGPPSGWIRRINLIKRLSKNMESWRLVRALTYITIYIIQTSCTYKHL